MGSPAEVAEETTAELLDMVVLDCALPVLPRASSLKIRFWVPVEEVIFKPRRIAARACALLPRFRFWGSKYTSLHAT